MVFFFLAFLGGEGGMWVVVGLESEGVGKGWMIEGLCSCAAWWLCLCGFAGFGGTERFNHTYIYIHLSTRHLLFPLMLSRCWAVITIGAVTVTVSFLGWRGGIGYLVLGLRIGGRSREREREIGMR